VPGAAVHANAPKTTVNTAVKHGRRHGGSLPHRRVMHMLGMAPELNRFPILVVDDEVDNLDAFRFNFKKSFQILTPPAARRRSGSWPITTSRWWSPTSACRR
jgi:hypothetical protein